MVAPEPVFEPRGTPLSVVGRMKAFSDLGHSVDLLTYPIGSDIDLPNIRFRRTRCIPGVKRVKIGPSITKIPLDMLLSLKTCVTLARERYDLVHAHEEAGFWGITFARWFGIPFIYDMHSSLPQQLSNFQFSRSRSLINLFRMLERWVLRHADAIITICPDLYEHVKICLPGKESELIENVVDYSHIFGEVDESETIRKKHELNGRRVALYTGTFEPYQGLELLIRSAGSVLQCFPDLVFLLVGGHPDQVATYHRMAESEGIASHIRFTGQVHPREVGSYIRCADMLLSPRISGTNTPLKIYAYLKSGVPVVATRLLTHTQVLNDSVAILTDPTPEGFAAGILRLLEDPASADRISAAAQKYGSEKFSYEAYVEKCRRVLDRAVGNEV